jgi:hypothetical protein
MQKMTMMSGAAGDALLRRDALYGPWLYDEIDELFGGDPLPYGLEENRTTLETFARYLVAQGLAAGPVKITSASFPLSGKDNQYRSDRSAARAELKSRLAAIAS